jgi:hypothetical protein
LSRGKSKVIYLTIFTRAPRSPIKGIDKIKICGIIYTESRERKR